MTVYIFQKDDGGDPGYTASELKSSMDENLFKGERQGCIVGKEGGYFRIRVPDNFENDVTEFMNRRGFELVVSE